MFSIKLISLIFIILFIRIECQNIAENIPGSDPRGKTETPFFGQCDRIALKGVMDCLENFLPNRVFLEENSGGMCCAYSKYQTCLTGLSDTLRTSFERAKCPRSYASQIIMSFGENVVGFSMRILCEQNKEKDPCSSRRTRINP